MEEKTLYTYRYVYNLIFGLLEVHVFIVQIKILCWSTSYEHVLQIIQTKMEYISFQKKKKYLKEDISYKIVQGNKRKVEGQFDTMIINV